MIGHPCSAVVAVVLAAFAALASAAPPTGVGTRQDCNGGNLCRIAVTISGGTCKVTSPAKDSAIVVARSSGPDVRMVWTLPGSYRFCGGDGVGFIDASNPFAKGAATNDPNGGDDAAGGCKKHFRWQNRNDASGQWRYQITFTAPDGRTKCSYDPWVINN